MIDLLKKELLIHGVIVNNNGIKFKNYGLMDLDNALLIFKARAKSSFLVAEKLWKEVVSLLMHNSHSRAVSTEGIDKIFINAIQGLKRMLYLYPGLSNFEIIEQVVNQCLCKDINQISYNTMCKIIEYKIGLEWVGHIISKNLYIRYLLVEYFRNLKTKRIVAKGVHGPFANLDIPMEERIFEWSSISDEVKGREKQKQNQKRYRNGLEGYNDPYVNEGFVWRELKNEPFLWGKEGENPYPHRNILWK